MPGTGTTDRGRHVRAVLRDRGFVRLMTARLFGQFGDGVFQAALAGAVLFDPERQAHAADVAAGFAVLLLPYSVIGPFAGVLIDRWWRQRILVVANLFRAAGVVAVGLAMADGLHGQPFYAAALVIISLSRFLLSTLSAALPHVVDDAQLPTANSLSTTAGALITTIGGGAAVGVQALLNSSQTAAAVTAGSAAVPFTLAALAARGFGVRLLGPDDVERGNRETAAAVVRGLGAGARHVFARRPAFYALSIIGVHRVCYGISTVCTLLLYRNFFTDHGFFRAGLGGLAQIVVTVAIGGGIAALVTPAAIRHLGFVRWPAILLTGAAAVQFVVLPYTQPAVLAAALLLGIASQGIKISVDTLVQEQISDDFRGRVFALYDTLFNIALVLAAVLTAVVLPENGHSPVSVLVIAAVYLTTAITYLRIATVRPAAQSPLVGVPLP